MNVFNNVILAKNRQLPEDDRMIETFRSIFKSFNVNNLSVCIGWCADQVNIYKVICYHAVLHVSASFAHRHVSRNDICKHKIL